MTKEQETLSQEKKEQSPKNLNDITFAPEKWLTDQEIGWALSQLSLPNNHQALPAHQFHYVSQARHTTEAQAYLAFPQLLSDLNSGVELVFIPVSNASAENDYQGTHWSLLVYKDKTKQFYHYDSLLGANYEYVKPLVKELLKAQGVSEQIWAEHLIPRHDIQQKNGYDCGIYVISLVKMLNVNPALLEGEMQEIDSQAERKYWRDKARDANKLEASLQNICSEWTDIHPDFDKKWLDGETYQQKWENRGFSYQETEKWIKAGLNADDYGYAYWLKFIKAKDDEWLLNEGKNSKKELRKECQKFAESKDALIEIEKEVEDKKIKLQKLQEILQNPQKITAQHIKELIQEVNELGKIYEKIKLTWGNNDASEISNSSNIFSAMQIDTNKIIESDDLVSKVMLKIRQKMLGLCPKCKQPNTNFEWCQPCNSQQLVQNFRQWTSENDECDELIKSSQLEANFSNYLAWIPYKQLENVKYLDAGGFGKIYRANWNNNNISSITQSKFGTSKKTVALKILNDSQNVTIDFLKEISYYKSIWGGKIVEVYGVTWDPITKNYAIVMDCMEGGNLRQYLNLRKNINNKLSLKEKLHRLQNVASALSAIHHEELIHKDLHAGNILSDHNFTRITDLGLCRPANEEDEEGKIYGALPYMAPEIFISKKYTQASDIYSFGMVAYEMLAELPPYHGIPHERPHEQQYLALRICEGLRPKFNVKLPSSLVNLIKKCWDADSSHRPTASELNKVLLDLWNASEDPGFNGSNNDQYKDASKLDTDFVLKNDCRSRLLGLSDLPEPQNNPSQEWQATTLLDLQVKGVKEKINSLKEEYLDSKLAELVASFIKIYQKILKNEDEEQVMEQIMKEAEELEAKLNNNGFTTENIEKIIKCCEKLVELEQQLENQELQAQVEVLTQN